MILEIVTTTADETIFAHENGADRVELVSGITEGALTPTLGALKGVAAKGIPAFCMIRPHAHGFVYSNNDIEEMREDIINLRDYASVFLFGVLTENKEIDEEKLIKLLEVVGDVPVTFHKAIDGTPDFRKSVETLAKYPQIKRILSNVGVSEPIGNEEEIRKQLAFCKEHGITVTFAGGVNLENIPALKKAGVEEIHISSAARIDGLAKNKLCPNRIQKFNQLRKQ